MNVICAFKQDATKLRYDDWDDLIGYCNLSAAPVGRYLVDLHGESVTAYPASDALCNALQVLNHLQDCRDDYQTLNRVYLPQNWMIEAGIGAEVLGDGRSTPALRQVLHLCLDATDGLLTLADHLPGQLRNVRFAMEAAAIVAIAKRLSAELRRRDPLAERVVLTAAQFAACCACGIGRVMLQRIARRAGRRSAATNPAVTPFDRRSQAKSRPNDSDVRDRSGETGHRDFDDVISAHHHLSVQDASTHDRIEPLAHVKRIVAQSGTSFLWGMRALPAERRHAMYAIYAFCREVDDVADEPGEMDDKMRALTAWRGEIARLYAGQPSWPTTRALLQPVQHFNLPQEEFLAVIDGMEADAAPTVRMQTLDELLNYCRKVAGAVGMLSIHAFGVPQHPGPRFAETLGTALQLTNILRDLKEDAALQRPLCAFGYARQARCRREFTERRLRSSGFRRNLCGTGRSCARPLR